MEKEELRKKLKQESENINRHMTEEAMELILHLMDVEQDSGKIAFMCHELTACSRGFCGYTHYRIKDRRMCPSTCCMKEAETMSELQISKITGL